MYDVVGDVHGHYDDLHRLMLSMGYIYHGGEHRFFNADGRKPIFIGDYIDRGHKNVKTVRLIRNMVQMGDAHAIMGNHDFNAVMMTMPDPHAPGEYLRRHTPSNLKQQKTFLSEVKDRPDVYAEMIDWLRTLPVYLCIGKANFAHACWYPTGIDYLARQGHLDGHGCITDSGWFAAGDKQSPSHKYFDIVLKGPKEKIPSRAAYQDAQGELRDRARIAWWNVAPETNGDAYASMPMSEFLNEPFIAAYRGHHAATIMHDLMAMPDDEHIFFGHISLAGDPSPLAKNVTCVDYGIGKGGCLTAFRMADMERPSIGEFVSVPSSRRHKDKIRTVHPPK